jgi:hypothetical protein
MGVNALKYSYPSIDEQLFRDKFSCHFSRQKLALVCTGIGRPGSDLSKESPMLIIGGHWHVGSATSVNQA